MLAFSDVDINCKNDVYVCSFFPQIHANTPESVFQFIEYVKLLLLYIHERFIIPSLQYLSTALQHAWKNLQESCKSVLNTEHTLRTCYGS